MYSKTDTVAGQRPAVYPAQAGAVLVSDGAIEVTTGMISQDSLLGLCMLPAGCVPIDFTLIEDDLDTGGDLLQSVGALNAGETDLTASTDFITSSNVGQEGGSARATSWPAALIAPAIVDRVIAVKVIHGGVAEEYAVGTITSSGTNVTAGNSVTIDSKAYTFRAAIYPDVVKATGSFESSGVNVTAADTVTLNGKAYTFRDAIYADVVKATGSFESTGVNVTATDTVTLNAKAYTFRDAIYPATVAATGTITSSGVNVDAGNSVTIDGTAYTFVTPMGAIDGSVLLGGTAAESLDNLKLAINRTDPGANNDVKYKIASAHATVEATTNTDTVQTLQALTPGAAGNALTLAVVGATLTRSDETLLGGTTISAEGDVLKGISAAVSLDNLALAVNRTDPGTNDGVKYKIAAAHPTMEATTNTDTVQTLQALTGGTGGNSLTLATTAVTLTRSASTLLGGFAASVEGDVLKGVSAAVSLDNLALAINRSVPLSNDGVKYKIAAAHPTMEATTNTDTVQTLQALTGGTDGNALTLATTAVTLTRSATTLLGGLAASVEGDVLMGSGGTAGENSAATLDNLKLAINRSVPLTNDGVKYKIAAAHTTVSATTNTDTVQTIQALAAGDAGNSITLTRVGATLTLSHETLEGGITAAPLQGGTVRGILTYRAEEYGQ